MTEQPFDQATIPLTFEEERLRRWRLMLGSGVNCALGERDGKMDNVLNAIYGRRSLFGRPGIPYQSGKRGGLEASAPKVSRWLGDIRTYFSESVVELMQRDAIERIGLRAILAHPELLEQIEPDVSLVATLLTLKAVIPDETKATARLLVRKVVDALLEKLENPLRQAIRGALNRAQRNRRPRHSDIDWQRTIRLNLKHYQAEYRTIIPETLIGFGRKRHSTYNVIIAIDQSGSMAASLVYASVFGAVMASIPALQTHLIVFDTSVVDLTPQLHDPVDVLFGATLGGGTNIDQALGYCQSLILQPENTTLILISDLIEGGNHDNLLKRTEQMVGTGVQLVVLLALSDQGVPRYDDTMAGHMAERGATAFGCTPDLFPELMAATMNCRDLAQWAAQHNIRVARPNQK